SGKPAQQRHRRLLPWSGWGGPDPHARQRRTSPSGLPASPPALPKKPFRRCFKPRPPWRAGCAGSPPAAGRGCKEVVVSSLGGCPASCPDAHRPTHGHRHVRNWAIVQISDLDARCKLFGLNESLAREICHKRGDAPRSQRCVNGSTRRALRMKAAMTTRPSAKKSARSTKLPVGPRSNRLAIAQPPAKAAPNTSAPIRIAAL